MLKSTMRHKVDLSCQIAAWICDLFKKSTHRSCTKFAKIKSKKLPQIKSDKKKLSHSRIKSPEQQNLHNNNYETLKCSMKSKAHLKLKHHFKKK